MDVCVMLPKDPGVGRRCGVAEVYLIAGSVSEAAKWDGHLYFHSSRFLDGTVETEEVKILRKVKG